MNNPAKEEIIRAIRALALSKQFTVEQRIGFLEDIEFEAQDNRESLEGSLDNEEADHQ
ncbi:hypothetical protein [Ectopseudomonas mendocina]|uniref:hypothetical protein n=1 Tax=Ectopseudomonas mendocina TaxID=300 RepID=UPI003EFE3F3F